MYVFSDVNGGALGTGVNGQAGVQPGVGGVLG